MSLKPPVKQYRKAAQPAYFNQLSLFDINHFDGVSVACLQQLRSPENRASGGLTEALIAPSIPSVFPYFQLKPTTQLVPRGTKGKLKANIAAIETAQKITAEGRTATDEERALMVQFTGWGGLASVWDAAAYAAYLVAKEYSEPVPAEFTSWVSTYGTLREKLDGLLTREEIDEAGRSTLSAYYTSRTIIDALWQAVIEFGFTGGDVLEPAAGTGHFIGLMPTALREASRITGIEKEPLSATICGLLYPEITLHQSGFEECRFANTSFDLVIGNVPFGSYKVYDSANKDLSALHIHNYFIGRSARLLRPGGLLAVITSAGTLDAAGRGFRDRLAAEGMELAGAIRLPCNAFAESGTEVTSDLVFMRKQIGVARQFDGHSFRQTVTLRSLMPSDVEAEQAQSIRINEYYAERPAMMVGEMFLASEINIGGLHRDDRQTLFLSDTATFQSRLQQAVSALPKAIYTPVAKSLFTRPGPPIIDPYAAFRKPVTIKGRTYSQALVVAEYERLKSFYSQLLQAEIDGQAETVTEPLRTGLNQTYDGFTRLFGTLNLNRSVRFLEEFDAQFATVQALETITRRGSDKTLIGKSGILTGRVYPLSLVPDRVTTHQDAIRVSLYVRGFLDLPFMAQKLGSTVAVTEYQLRQKRLVFEDPTSGRLIDRASYLSGNVREKLAIATEKVAFHPELSPNVQALEAVMPATVPFAAISFQLGSVWLPIGVIERFICQTLDMNCELAYNERAAHYYLTYGGMYAVKDHSLGTPKRRASELIEAALNNRSLVVTKTVHVEGKEVTVKDVEATSQAIQAQENLQELFVDYVRLHHAEAIVAAFNDRFNSTVMKAYEKPYLATYPGANPAITLRDHQFRGVERGKEQDTMFAHVVGSGKTFTMITTAMELKRLGKINKAVIAVQNSTVADFGRAWQALYPAAIIYVPDKADLEAANRSRFLQRIATNNFDGIVLPNSFLKLIPDDPIDAEALMQSEIDQLVATLDHLDSHSRKQRMTVKQVNQKILSFEMLRKRKSDRKMDDILHFGQLGVDFLALDEAHTKKRLGFSTHRQNIKGIDTQGSQDAWQAMTKCRTMQRKGGRVILATGTPISNTMAEAWTMLRYVAQDELSARQLGTFDQFAATFGQIIPSFELTATGNFKCVDRFARFVNVRQLSELYRNHVDVVLNEDIIEFKRDNTLPRLKNDAFTSVILPQTQGVFEELQRIRQELLDFDKLTGAEKRENSHIPLVMFGQARKATLDIRLLDAANPDEEASKVNHAVGLIWAKYLETADYNGTQLVFSDTYQSPDVKSRWLDEDGKVVNANFGAKRFNLFDDITQKLISRGLPAEQIATVPADANKREPIFERVRTGEVRILLGTSERMGIGVNVQQVLAAIHHLDAPNRPTDFEQRNGRGIRQGNRHAAWGKSIEVFTYGVEKTLDATVYGRMAIKQRFINQVLRGEVGADTMQDISADDDFASLSFDQMMATLSGSQYALAYTAKNHELQRLYQQRKNHTRSLIDAQAIVERAGQRIKGINGALGQMVAEAKTIDTLFGGTTITEIVVGDECLTTGWGMPLESYVRRLKSQAKRGHSEGLIRVNRLPVTLRACIVDTDFNGKVIYGITYSWGLSLAGTVTSGQGLLLSIRHQLDTVRDAPNRAEKNLMRAELEYAEYNQKLHVPFKRDGEISELEGLLAELKENMERETILA